MSELDALLGGNSTEADAKTKRTLLSYIAACTWYVFAVYLTVPARPALILAAAAGDAGGAAIFNGFVDSFQAILCFVTAPLLGSLGDNVGRIPIFLFCVTVEVIILYLIAIFRKSLTGLFISLSLIAISKSSITSLTAAIADIANTRESSTRAFALLGAAENISITLGPFLGGLIVSVSFYAMPFLLGATILLLSLPFLAKLPESRDGSPSLQTLWQTVRSTRLESPLQKVKIALLETRALTLLTVSFVLESLAEDGTYGVIYYYAQGAVGWTSKDFGIYVSVAGLASMMSQFALTPLFVRLFGERNVIIGGFLSNGVRFFIIAVSSKNWILWASIVFGIPYFAARPQIKAVLSRQVSQERQGRLQGSLSAVNSLVSVMSSLCIAALFAISNSLGVPGAVFYGTTAMTVVAAYLAHLGLAHSTLL